MKTKECIKCGRDATAWGGYLLKSRDYVKAGFCELHYNSPCPNLFGKKGVYGIFNKSNYTLVKDNYKSISSVNNIEQ